LFVTYFSFWGVEHIALDDGDNGKWYTKQKKLQKVTQNVRATMTSMPINRHATAILSVLVHNRRA
jgi:hypothetical protein